MTQPARLARIVLAILVTTAPARASRWFAPPPAEDAEPTLARRASPEATQPEATQPETAPWLAVTAAAAAYDVAAGIVGYGRSGVAAVAGLAGAAVWEASYALGVNRTPAPPSDLEEPPVAAPAMAPAVIPVAVRVPPAAPAPMTALPSLPPPAAAATPAGAPAGLLANFVYDSAARQADGGFFVPKPLQRLFAVRTRTAAAADVPVTLTLTGRIVPDPQAHGHVEASVVGRIAGPPGGLPVLGQTVAKGQILAFVSPAVGVVDRTQMRREVARLTTEIRLETESLERLKQFMFVAFRDGKITQSQLRIEGLRRERAALLPMLDTQEALRAPTDGVVSIVRAIEGGVVRPGEAIFDIVNPARLWVEAAAPDPATAADASAAVAASARTPEGEALRLRFVGSGLALREQATPILFRIDEPPPGLRLDRPVTVSLQAARTQHGIALPREAVVAGADGVTLVWEQTGPESFTAHPVRARDLDGERVLVVDGLADGARVVCGDGVRLMAQLQ